MLLRLLFVLICVLCFGTGEASARLVVSRSGPVQAARPAVAAVPVAPPAVAAAEQSVSIMGAAEATEEQMVAFIRERNPQPKLTCSIEELVATYFREGAIEGVRGDVALCQALKETGFFRYGGHVQPQQNNFCGLGTTGGGVQGASFTTVERGVRAHIQHLLAYASTERPHQAIVDPRYDLVRKAHPDYAGMVDAWTGLNGSWAVPGKNYGESILQMWSAAKGDSEVQARLMREYTRSTAKGDAQAYLKRGKLYAQQKQYAKALSDYKQAALFGPLKAEVLVYQGLAYEAMGDTAQAGQSYDRAIAADRRNQVAWSCLNNFRKRPNISRPQAVRPPHSNEGGTDKMKDRFMDEAVQEADSNLRTNEGGPFGAVIVKDGKVVARGHNRVLKMHDPTAHAEVETIRAAAKKLGTHDLSGCELYTSCYPCPMCMSAIIWANIKKVYYGNTAQDAADIGFRDDFIYTFIEQGRVDAAVLDLEAYGRDKTISSFKAFAAKTDKTIY